MKRYKVTFNGRTRNAIGIFYPITEIIELEYPEIEEERLTDQIRLNLYDKYEHVTFISYQEIKDE